MGNFRKIKITEHPNWVSLWFPNYHYFGEHSADVIIDGLADSIMLNKNNYLFRVSNRNTAKRLNMFKANNDVVLVCLFLTLNTCHTFL